MAAITGSATLSPMASKKAKSSGGHGSKSLRIREMLQAGVKPMEIAKKVKCTPGLVYIVRSKMGGGGSTKKAKPAGRRGRPRASAAISGDIDSIVAAVKSSEQERARMRSALERIQAILNDALN